jgi:hypothetical protein
MVPVDSLGYLYAGPDFNHSTDYKQQDKVKDSLRGRLPKLRFALEGVK